MATAELQLPNSKLSESLSNDKELNIKFLKLCIEEATQDLVLRDFTECLQACERGLNRAKLNFEDHSVQSAVESLAVIGIQAYAELDMWQSVLPFIQGVYNGIESCPAVIIQLCVLLHAKVAEYAQCHAIASIWLRNSNNALHGGYSTVAQLYVTHVLVPQGKTEMIQTFLDAFKPLTTSVKQEIVSIARKLEGSMVDISEDIRKVGQSHRHPTDGSVDIFIYAKNIARRFGVFIIQKLHFVNFGTVVKVAAIAVCIWLVTVEANRGDVISNFERVSVVLRGAQKLWKSLFTSTVVK